MDPILFSFKSITVYTFGFALMVSALVMAFLLWRRLRRFGYEEMAIVDMVLLSGVVALVLARIVYVLTHWASFEGVFLKMILVTYFPGLDGLGAMVGVIGTVLVFTFIKRWKGLDVFDSVFMSLGLGVVIIMLGSFFSGSLPGVSTYLPWATTYPGLVDKRHPIPLYWMGLAVIFYVASVLLDRFRYIPGLVSVLFLFLFGVGLLALTPLTDMGDVSWWWVYGMAVVMLGIAGFLTVMVWKRLPYWLEKKEDESSNSLPMVE